MSAAAAAEGALFEVDCGVVVGFFADAFGGAFTRFAGRTIGAEGFRLDLLLLLARFCSEWTGILCLLRK